MNRDVCEHFNAVDLPCAKCEKPQSNMTQPRALFLADVLEHTGNSVNDAAAAELRRLHAENEKLRTVMVAAAEEIAAHWDAHCDSDGYGPVNLMRRLEEGIAAEYGYTAGAFGRLHAQRDALLEALKNIDKEFSKHGRQHWPEAVKARAAIAKAEEKA